MNRLHWAVLLDLAQMSSQLIGSCRCGNLSSLYLLVFNFKLYQAKFPIIELVAKLPCGRIGICGGGLLPIPSFNLVIATYVIYGILSYRLRLPF